MSQKILIMGEKHFSDDYLRLYFYGKIIENYFQQNEIYKKKKCRKSNTVLTLSFKGVYISEKLSLKHEYTVNQVITMFELLRGTFEFYGGYPLN